MMMATIEQQRGNNPASEPQQHQDQQHQEQHQEQQPHEQQLSEEQASWLMPPPQTPAVQFYAPSSSSKSGSTGSHSNHYHHNSHTAVKRGGDNNHYHTSKSHPAASSSLHPAMDYPLAGSTSQSSSSSSLSSMAATLVSGVISPRMLPPPPGPHHQPMTHGTAQPLHQQQQVQLKSNSGSFFGGFGFGQNHHHSAYPVNNNPNAESPISPAQMFDGALENLFLPQSEQHLPFALCEPPPSRTTTAAATDLHLTTTSNTTNNNSSSTNNNHNMGPPEPRMSAATAAASITAAISSNSSNVNHDSSNNNSWPQPILPYSNLYLHPHLLNTVASLSRPTVPETEEKRAIRLERNRMSARRSRRKKKERLETLGAQVNDLHIVLEAERRRQIDCMVPAFEQLKLLMTAASMVEVIHATEPNNFLHRAILDFQYTQLKTLTMAPYQRFLMWLLLQDPSYFRAKEAQNKKFLKISSKQIGEQLTVQSAAIHDAQTAWPLFCFELKFSVDQEERFVAAIATHHHHNNNNSTSNSSPSNVNNNNQDNHKKANQIQMALDTADRLCKAMGSLSHLVAKRQRQTVLTFAQRQILRQHAQEQNQQKNQTNPMATAATLSSSPSTTVSPETDSSPAPCMDLSDICRSLESVLHISNSVVFVENTVHGSSNNNTHA
jgi:hypothetical protein